MKDLNSKSIGISPREQNILLKTALDAALKGAAVTLKYFKRVKHVDIKEGAGLVSEADRGSERVIMQTVHKAYPHHRFLGEETGYSDSGCEGEALWVVDPLDGTTNYIHGFPFFCVSIGIEIAGVIEVGVVHAPILGWTYTAKRGRGAYLNGKSINVSRTQKIEDSLLATGFSYQKNKILERELIDFKSFSEDARGIRRSGSAALDMCMVASGVFDGFWERELAPWDTAAGSLIVSEAGGKVTSFNHEKFHYSMKSVIAATPKIHTLIHNAIAKNQEAPKN
jgi:myo-inositol-1(or 4)-monophosphatase